MNTIITTPAPIETCVYRNGFARINVEAFMGDHVLADQSLAVRCMIGSWASLLNIGRKGEAKQIWEMGKKAFGEKVWEAAMEECFEISRRSGDKKAEAEEGVAADEK